MKNEKKNNSPAGEQWRHHIRSIDPDKEPAELLNGAPVLLGFACDEGVRRNNGRPGAESGPENIRNALARLAWHDHGEVLDAGDIVCQGGNLETAQSAFGGKISRLLHAGSFPIGLGGGHEIAIAHYTGIRSCIGNSNLGIINFDAHFDMRIPADQQGNSGTSFYQIARHCQKYQHAFNYLCIGLQKENNTKILFDTAKEYQAEWILSSDVHLQYIESLIRKLNRFVDKVDHVYLSVCLDVLHASAAPGVSAVNPLGIYPDIALELIRHIAASGKLISIDLAELNPVYDIDHRTARLAAALIFHVLDCRNGL